MRLRAPTRSASGWRARTTKIFRSRRGCCPAAMRPHVAAVYAFARTADDFADEGRPARREERLRLLDDWENRLHACVEAGQRRSGGSNISRGWTDDSHVQPSGDALRGSAQRVSSGYHDASVPDVARRAGLLPPIGQSGGTARAADRRLRRSAPRPRPPMRCARRSSSRTSGRTSGATGRRAGCTCRSRMSTRVMRPCAICPICG